MMRGGLLTLAVRKSLWPLPYLPMKEARAVSEELVAFNERLNIVLAALESLGAEGGSPE